jgi:long-subunit acyl-CoA synthetase (AMP-forming)
MSRPTSSLRARGSVRLTHCKRRSMQQRMQVSQLPQCLVFQLVNVCTFYICTSVTLAMDTHRTFFELIPKAQISSFITATMSIPRVWKSLQHLSAAAVATDTLHRQSSTAFPWLKHFCQKWTISHPVRTLFALNTLGVYACLFMHRRRNCFDSTGTVLP